MVAAGASAGVTRRALVFGARGQIGHFVLPRLRAEGWHVHAVTRAELPPTQPGVEWHRHELFGGPDLRLDVEVILSLGPLDGFAAWWQRSACRPRCIVAFGSTSAIGKLASPEPAERALAECLLVAERQLHEHCAARGVAATVLRPTLVYGAGTDRNLTRIAQLAARWGAFALPRDACGLRQPVHAADLAAAACRAADCVAPLAAHYDLPGGETLAYREMVRRVLACLQPVPRLVEFPLAPLRAALWAAHRVGVLGDARAGVLSRLFTDLVYDDAAARRDLVYRPRRFEPKREMFVSKVTNGA